MKVEKKLLPASIVELIVEMDVKEVSKHREKALKHLEKNAEIKGFRK
jgi:FKBP-type peptidyl-prolyl cis-trans isomerase (trigger factor)